MSTAVLTERSALSAFADRALGAATQLWFVVAVAGQWLFAAYVAAFYAGTALRGQHQLWNRVLAPGHVAGDTLGNGTLVAHLALAVVILIGGPLQLVPRLRARFPVWHRWSGRLYMLTALVLASSGLYLVWVRGGSARGDLAQHLGISLNAALIVLCALLAWRSARAGALAAHRRWALRLFLAVNGVWFFRIGLMLWIALHGRPVGFDPEAFSGPFLSFLAFAQSLVPLAVLELLLWARERGSSGGRLAMAGALVLLTLAMGAGIVVASLGLWLPRMASGDERSDRPHTGTHAEATPRTVVVAPHERGRPTATSWGTFVGVAYAADAPVATATPHAPRQGVARAAWEPLVAFHVAAGTLALLAGAAALLLRKGSPRHRRVGHVFALAMLSMTASALYVALAKGQTLNALMAILTSYLVATGWLAGRRREARVGRFDWAALLIVLATAAALLAQGLGAARSQTGAAGGFPAGVWLFFGSLACLTAASDVRLLVRGGAQGAQRVARHLWRMSLALLIAVSSLFLGQPQVFPVALRRSGLLALPSLVTFVLMVVWLLRVKRPGASRQPA